MRNLLSCLAIAMLVSFVGCGEPAAPATTPDAPATEGSDTSSTAATGEMTDVSINVPGMTWGGCVSAVSKSLASIGATDFEGDNSTNPPTATFKISADMDIDAKLNELAETNSKLEGWEKQ